MMGLSHLHSLNIGTCVVACSGVGNVFHFAPVEFNTNLLVLFG